MFLEPWLHLKQLHVFSHNVIQFVEQCLAYFFFALLVANLFIQSPMSSSREVASFQRSPDEWIRVSLFQGYRVHAADFTHRSQGGLYTVNSKSLVMKIKKKNSSHLEHART